MKLEQLESFLELTNSKEIVKLLVDKDDEEINLIYDMLQNKKQRTDLEMITLIKRYFHCCYDRNIVFLILNSDIIEHRTLEEQIQLIDKFIGLGNCEDILGLFYNEYILSYRNCKEQITLIDKYIQLKQNKEIFALIINASMLKYRTCEQQLNLIDKYIEFGKEDFWILQIICDNKILENRTYDEQIKLIDRYIELGSDINIAKLILNICIDSSFIYINSMIDKYIKLDRNEDILNIISKLKGTEEEKNILFDKYIKSGCDAGVSKIMLEGYYSPLQRIYLIDRYIESGKSESFLEIIPFYPLISYDLLLQNIEKYFEENEHCEKSVLELIDELGSLREVIGILRENEITEFNQDTKINTYLNKVPK